VKHAVFASLLLLSACATQPGAIAGRKMTAVDTGGGLSTSQLGLALAAFEAAWVEKTGEQPCDVAAHVRVNFVPMGHPSLCGAVGCTLDMTEIFVATDAGGWGGDAAGADSTERRRILRMSGVVAHELTHVCLLAIDHDGDPNHGGPGGPWGTSHDQIEECAIGLLVGGDCSMGRE
jgi:hypothetical protein